MLGADALDAIAARAFAGPLTDDDTGALLVHADRMQQAGDPRGELLALEVADRRRDRRRDLRTTIVKHLVAHCPSLIGDATPLLETPRMITLDLRAGRLYAITIDTRHATVDDTVPIEHLRRALTMPLARTVRRVHVHLPRIRSYQFSEDTSLRLADGLALEELEISTHGTPAPLRRVAYGQEPWRPDYRRTEYDAVWTRCPDLWWWSYGASLFIPPPPHASAPERVQLGRALVRPESHADALGRIAALGEGGAPFVHALILMTSPGVVPWIDPIARTLGAIGAGAREALPRLARIAGDPAQPPVTRRGCGRAVHAITTALAARGM